MKTKALLGNVFTPLNYSYHHKEGGYQDFNAVMEFVYNAMPFFFPKTGGK